jgi:hypothetical protein
MSVPRDFEAEQAEREKREAKEAKFKKTVLGAIMASWITFYVLTFFIWLGAIWASPLKLFFTGLLTLVVAVCLTVLWLFLSDEW